MKLKLASCEFLIQWKVFPSTTCRRSRQSQMKSLTILCCKPWAMASEVGAIMETPPPLLTGFADLWNESARPMPVLPVQRLIWWGERPTTKFFTLNREGLPQPGINAAMVDSQRAAASQWPIFGRVAEG